MLVWLALAVLLILVILLLAKYAFKTIVILSLVFIALYITNPNEERFKTHYSNQITQEGIEKNLLEKLALEGIETQGKVSLKRKNMILFSIYQVDRLDKKVGYLGLFNTFIPIYEKDESVI